MKESRKAEILGKTKGKFTCSKLEAADEKACSGDRESLI
jgi:hypothetical protein